MSGGSFIDCEEQRRYHVTVRRALAKLGPMRASSVDNGMIMKNIFYREVVSQSKACPEILKDAFAGRCLIPSHCLLVREIAGRGYRFYFWMGTVNQKKY